MIYTLESAVNEIIHIDLRERGFTDNETLNRDGIIIDKYELTQILESLRRCNSEQYTVRGTLNIPNIASVRYENEYFSYEKYSDMIFVGATDLSYKNVTQIKMFISHANWIDFHFHFENEIFYTMVIVPK